MGSKGKGCSANTEWWSANTKRWGWLVGDDKDGGVGEGGAKVNVKETAKVERKMNVGGEGNVLR